MTALSTRQLSPIEYLAYERQATERHELHQGQLIAMSGATREHNLINGNIYRRLANQLDGHPCETYSSGLRVATHAGRNYYYPDVVVACGQPELEDRHGDTLLNPTVVIGVLSPSTESFDRGSKFSSYRTIPSLRQYVLVSQDIPQVEVFTRTSDTSWCFTDYQGLDAVVPLTSIGCQLTLKEIYDRIVFPEVTSNREAELTKPTLN